MTLWLLPFGTPLRREAAEIVARSVEQDLSAEEWAEVARLRAEANRLEASVRDEQQVRPENLYDHAVAKQRRLLVHGGSAEERLTNQERLAVPAALRVPDHAGNPHPVIDIMGQEVSDAGWIV